MTSDKTPTCAKSQHGGIIFKLLFLMCLAVFCFFLYVARHPLLRLAGGFWIVDDPPKPSDAIVMLSDDDYQADRAGHAADLYKAGWAPHVIASGRLLRPYAGIAELEEHDLESRGVPENAIVKVPGADRNTLQECQNIGQFISAHSWKRIILVTSNYHTRRARYICSRVLPSRTVLIVSSASDSNYDPQDWWTTRQGTKMFFGETVGIVVAMWELRHSDVETSDPSSGFDIRSMLPH